MKSFIPILCYLSIVAALAHPRLYPRESKINTAANLAAANVPPENDGCGEPRVENTEVLEEFLSGQNEGYTLRGDEEYLYEMVGKYLPRNEYDDIGEEEADHLLKRSFPLRQDEQGRLLVSEEYLWKREEDCTDEPEDSYLCGGYDNRCEDNLSERDNYHPFDNGELGDLSAYYYNYLSKRDKDRIEESDEDYQGLSEGYPFRMPDRHYDCCHGKEGVSAGQTDYECSEEMEYGSAAGGPCNRYHSLHKSTGYPRAQGTHYNRGRDEFCLRKIYLDYYRMVEDKYLLRREGDRVDKKEDCINGVGGANLCEAHDGSRCGIDRICKIRAKSPRAGLPAQ